MTSFLLCVLYLLSAFVSLGRSALPALPASRLSNIAVDTLMFETANKEYLDANGTGNDLHYYNHLSV
jgi:hypothetical protein